MNTLSVTLDFPKLIVSSGQIDIREDVNQRICNIINNLKSIDSDIDQVMDGWRLKRLPRIDRDILRLAYVDINFLGTPLSVACCSSPCARDPPLYPEAVSTILRASFSGFSNPADRNLCIASLRKVLHGVEWEFVSSGDLSFPSSRPIIPKCFLIP